MRLLVASLLLMAIACSKKSQFRPASLEGKVLTGTVTSSSGTFSDLEGYQFRTLFTSKNQFETKNNQGAIESLGQYDFKKNRLILQSNFPLHPNETIEVFLHFTDPHSGTYEARRVDDKSSEQSGIFSLKQHATH
ncbi:MAG: hypothetical protein I8H75_02885 [Myxococcaceae bacterium]|nr:hypothetical protein [Myxococcaceae bacterium]MBH2006276.1 hypothetical protein [Myxococcaceae bacterium]